MEAAAAALESRAGPFAQPKVGDEVMTLDKPEFEQSDQTTQSFFSELMGPFVLAKIDEYRGDGNCYLIDASGSDFSIWCRRELLYFRCDLSPERLAELDAQSQQQETAENAENVDPQSSASTGDSQTAERCASPRPTKRPRQEADGSPLSLFSSSSVGRSGNDQTNDQTNDTVGGAGDTNVLIVVRVSGVYAKNETDGTPVADTKYGRSIDRKKHYIKLKCLAEQATNMSDNDEHDTVENWNKPLTNPQTAKEAVQELQKVLKILAARYPDRVARRRRARRRAAAIAIARADPYPRYPRCKS